MLEQIHDEALSAEYTQRLKDAAAANRLRDKERMLAMWREQHAMTLDEKHKAYCAKQIQKCEKYIEERKKS